MHAICNSIEKKISKLQNAKETIFPNKDYDWVKLVNFIC
jgi:hypothetical protein